MPTRPKLFSIDSATVGSDYGEKDAGKILNIINVCFWKSPKELQQYSW